MDFVVFVLTAIFDKSANAAGDIAKHIHRTGSGIVAAYSLETCQAKVTAVELLSRAAGYALKCSVGGQQGTLPDLGKADAPVPSQCNVKGWGLTGSHAGQYSCELIGSTFEGKPVVRMWRSGYGDEGFGAMYQVFDARAYHGQRVRFSAALRTVEVTAHAALCLRVDGPNSRVDQRSLAFDNMDDRPTIAGTTDWGRHSCVVDVPAIATEIFISNILAGRGELHWTDLRFEVVDASVPVTDMSKRPLNEAPANLGFTE